MLEEIQRYLHAATDYFGLLSILIGCAVGYTLTVMLERYFMPTAADAATKRHQKGVTFLFCWAASGIASALLWWSLDGETAAYIRVTVSAVIGVLSFPLYPVVVRWLCGKYPAIGSAWNRGDE